MCWKMLGEEMRGIVVFCVITLFFFTWILGEGLHIMGIRLLTIKVIA